MNGKDNESLLHLEQGRRILSKLDSRGKSQAPDIDIIKRHLVPLYLRMTMTSFLFGGRPVPIPQSPKSFPDLPNLFESVQEVGFVLYDFMDEALRFMQRARMARYGDDVSTETFAELENEKQDLLLRLSKFSAAFLAYQSRTPSRLSEVTSARFQMYLHMMSIWISTALSNHEASFDEHLASFSAIIPLAATILNHADSPSSSATAPSHSTASLDHERSPTGAVYRSGRQQPMFTFETNGIPILYYVATKCRHPLIRHSALDLLKQNPTRLSRRRRGLDL